jgi:hypothetical protein
MLFSLQAERGGISIDTEKTDLQTTSKLTVAGVTQRDAGNYTCRPAETRPASVLLIVLEGNFRFWIRVVTTFLGPSRVSQR